jgi:hypothetical protein
MRKEGSAFAQQDRALGESLKRVRANEEEFRRHAQSATMQKLSRYSNALQEIRSALDVAYGDDQLESVLPTIINVILEEAGID